MQKTHYSLVKKNPKKERDWKMHGRTKDRRNRELEIEGTKDALSPQEEGLQVSL